jgi:hypothetical protein
MTGLNLTLSSLRPLSPGGSPLAMPALPEPRSPAHAPVGAKRPPSVALDAEHSPNKLRRVASPLNRWAGETPMPAAAHTDALTLGEEQGLFDEVLAHDLDPLQPQQLLSDPFAANADPCVFAGDELGLLTGPHPPEPDPELVMRELVIQQAVARATALQNSVQITGSEHQNMVLNLCLGHHKLAEITFVLKFLAYLESCQLNWATLRGDLSNPRPLELENQVNAAINKKKVSSGMRPALNQIYQLRLQGNCGIRPVWVPKQAAHLKFLAEKIPLTASKAEMSSVSGLLGCLEAENIEWHMISQPVVGEHPRRPLALEAWMNTAIAKQKLQSRVRTDVNKLFNLLLKTACCARYKLPEHTDLMDQLPENISGAKKSKVRCFLLYLERIESCWSHQIELPQGVVDSKRPPRLEKTVNFATSGECETPLSRETRTSLNDVFGFDLKSSTHHEPKLAEHKELLESIPVFLENNKKNRYRNYISRFFFLLEEQNKSLSNLRKVMPGEQEKRPLELEKMVNYFITYGRVNIGLRASLNRIFDLRLRGPVSVYKEPGKASTHGV